MHSGREHNPPPLGHLFRQGGLGYRQLVHVVACQGLAQLLSGDQGGRLLVADELIYLFYHLGVGVGIALGKVYYVIRVFKSV